MYKVHVRPSHSWWGAAVVQYRHHHAAVQATLAVYTTGFWVE